MTDVVPNTRLFQRLERSQHAIGSYTRTGAREMVEVLGDVGFDYAVVDMMIAPTNWETAADLAAAAYQFNMTPWLRLQSYPWSGEPRIDTRLAADVLRALSIGFQVIQISVDGPMQVEEALRPRLNEHRRVHLASFNTAAHTTEASYREAVALIEARTLIVPSIESLEGVAQLDAILALPGMRVLKLGMGDLTTVLGHRGDFEHPDVKDFVKKTVNRAAKHDVKLVVNIHGKFAPRDFLETAQWMWAAGVAVIEIPAPTYLLNHFYLELLGVLRGGASGV